MLKTVGYLISSVSVLLLAIPAWKSAAEHPLILFALIAGMAASVIGMFLRWLSFVRERREKAATSPATAPPQPSLRSRTRMASSVREETDSFS